MSSFVQHMARYHSPADSSASYPSAVPVISPVLGFGGMGSPSRSVNVIAADRGTLGALRSYELEDRDYSRASGAAFLGGVATIALSGGLAYVLRTMSNTTAELKRAREFKAEELPSMSEAERRELRPIVNKHIEILEGKAFHQRNIVVLTGSALACALTAFLGGMFSIQWLITAAIIAGVATGAFAIFAAVWHATDSSGQLPEEMRQKLIQLTARG